MDAHGKGQRVWAAAGPAWMSHCLARVPTVALACALLFAWAFGPSLTGSGLARAGEGGGTTLGGLAGQYYANPDLVGVPGFVRRDVRLDFGLNSLAPGGAGHVGDAAFRSVPATEFSVRWAGQLIPRFSETYTFVVRASGRVALQLRPAGTEAWTVVLSQTADTEAEVTGTAGLTAGTPYDVNVAMAHHGGPWTMCLRWSSPSTPQEVVDPLVDAGINNPDWTAGFTDIVKGARNSWEGPGGGPRPAMDANGWPMGDGAYVFQESLNQGLDVDPLMRGQISFSFRGKATVTLQGNVKNGSLTSHYDSSENLTTGSFVVINNGWNASYFRFSQSHRDGRPDGPGGIAELRLMRPVAPDAATSWDPATSLFTPQLMDAMSRFTVIRHQLVANQQRDWSDRTAPAYFNQSGGATSPPHYAIGEASANGASWEHKILLANETGRDLMISLPTVASGRTASDTSSYIWKIANLIRYGSDGNEPYTSATVDPVCPPLNPNLRAYLELGNELWNWASVFYVDWANVHSMTAADADANNEDFRVLNFDGLPLTRDAGGQYVSMNTWRFRKILLRMIQISDIFREVFGDAAMMTRIRPLYEWQYANDNDTARLALSFADLYFNNGDGRPHCAQPRPIGYWLWGGGGATYYGAVNGDGLTQVLPNPDFAAPDLAGAGYHQAPDGGTWSFTGTAGIARDGGPSDDIPPAFRGSQVGYVTDLGTLSIPVTFPWEVTSPVFGVAFKAVNHGASGGATDRETLRVFLDGTTDITARTFSQGNGYMPAGYDPAAPWTANNVFWTRSDYYFTKSFSVVPGSTHTITLRGMGDLSKPPRTNQTAFIGEVRVTSVDRIFGDGMPGGGEATGQPVGQNIQRTMNTEAAWARAFGLAELSYESGWSLGGDDGGSWVQLRAKYGDTRTAGVQATFMDMFHRAGSKVNVFGTYAQWPSWADYFAEQGLLDVGRYPIMQGIADRASHLPPEPDNGVLAPAVLIPLRASISDHADVTQGLITQAGAWISWNVITPRAGPYELGLGLAAGSGGGVLLVDNQEVAAVPEASTGVTGIATLTKGLHSVKVRVTSARSLRVGSIRIAGVGAPPSPTGLSVVEGDGQATLDWTAVAGATQYQVRYGTAPGSYTDVLDVGPATHAVVTGLTNNEQYFFVVIASSDTADGLPCAEKGVIPLAPGQPGTIALWEFAGATGSEASAMPACASARVRVSALQRGAGLGPSQSDWAAGMRANRFASEPSAAAGHSYGVSLAQAVTKRQYYEFSVEPVAGHAVSYGQITFLTLFQNGSGNAGVTWSTNGTVFSPGVQASGKAADRTAPWTVDLSGVPELQGTTAAVTFRIYLFGLGPYEVSGLGDASGSDVAVNAAISG